MKENENNNSKFTSRNLKKAKKTLYLKKINIYSKENNTLYKGLSKFFNDENFFFNNKINGSQIILGKINKNSEDSIYKLNKQKILRPLKKKKSFKSNSTHVISSNSGRTNKNLLFGKEKTPITDSELNNIYEHFKSIKYSLINNNNLTSDLSLNNNNNSEKNFFDKSKTLHKSFTLKPTLQLKNMLNLQEEILEKENENNKKKKIEKKIYERTKRKENESIMNSGITYRIIKELKEKTNNEIEKNSNYNSLESNWLLNLRRNFLNNNNNKNYKEIFINMGSFTRPNYNIVYKKLNYNNEKIRFGFNHLREIDKKNFLKNKYLSQRNDYSLFKKSFHDLKDIKILGKDLLKCEIENSKLIKGKKIIYQNKHRIEEINDKIFCKSYSMKDFFNNNIIDNCYKIHDI